MSIRVEFYGIARARAGVSAASVETDGPPTLGKVFAAMRKQFPALAAHCFEQDALHPAFVANINGEAFARDPQTPVAPDAVVLLLSTDAGG